MDSWTEQRIKLGKQLKLARQSAKMKQDQAARLLKVPVSTISAMETGKRKVEVVELFQLAALYQKPLAWFTSEKVSSEKISSWRLENIQDPVVRDAVVQLLQASKPLQKRAAYGLIGFLSER
jgi:transcriptional regulator with XRE-family HTH domain